MPHRSSTLKRLSKSVKEPKTPGQKMVSGLKNQNDSPVRDFSRTLGKRPDPIAITPRILKTQDSFDASRSINSALTRQKSTLASLKTNAIKRDMLMKKLTNPLQFFREDHRDNRFDFNSVTEKLIDLVNYNRVLKQWASQS